MRFIFYTDTLIRPKVRNKRPESEGKMNVKEEVYEQILEILKDAKFPINTMEELIAALPEGWTPHAE